MSKIKQTELEGKHLKPLTQELGGKSPLMVLADADTDEAVEAAHLSIFFFQGRACMGASRIFLQRAIADEFTEKFKATAVGSKMADLSHIGTSTAPPSRTSPTSPLAGKALAVSAGKELRRIWM